VSDDVGYYQRRLQEERQAAATARSERTRLFHQEMAELYAKMLNALHTSTDNASQSLP
jgi:hypothetical protein